MQYGLLHIILKEALKSDGCPICTLSASVMNNYFYWLLYENVNALHIRKRLIESGGYCNAHARLLYQTERREWADSMGTAIIYHDLIEDAIQGIERLSPKQRRTLFKDRWKGLFNRRKQSKEEGKQVLCPACSYQRQFEDIHINSLVEFLKLP